MKFEDFPLWRLESKLEKIGAADLNVLISGEPGTLKETIARRIFETSSRKNGLFEKLDAKSFRLDEILAGAAASPDGGGGTLYVDGVSELEDDQQKRLLRVADRESPAPLRTDYRIIAASDVDLMSLVRRGSFRKDLYFRLCEVEIKAASLRERPNVIPELFRHLLSERGKQSGPGILITPQQTDLLRKYCWPGNLRELKAFADRVAQLSDPTESFEALQRRHQEAARPALSLPQVLTLARKRAELKAVGTALQRTGQDRTAAAKLLRISVRRLNGIEGIRGRE